MSKQPLSPTARLRLFEASIKDYERLDAAYPLGHSLNMAGHRDDDQRRWQIVLHAAVLRKYFAPNDTLFIGNVLRAVRACVLPIFNWTDDFWDTAFTNGPLFTDTSKIHSGDFAPVGESSLLRDELYGRYLHGDHEKWARALSRNVRVNDTAVYFAVVHQRRRLWDTVRFVRNLDADHWLIWE